VKKKVIWIFGYSKSTKMIADSLNKNEFTVNIIDQNEDNYKNAIKDEYISYKIDITDDDELEKLNIHESDILVCIMDDEHLNVFLTLSLRSICPTNEIISISHSIYATQKLKMAGANKVIDIYQVSANRIHNIFSKPVATKLLDNFISTNHNISFREIRVLENSFIDGKIIESIDFSVYNIIMIGMVDLEIGDHFIFSTTNINHKIDADDIIVCLGKDSDLDYFENILKESIS